MFLTLPTSVLRNEKKEIELKIQAPTLAKSRQSELRSETGRQRDFISLVGILLFVVKNLYRTVC